MDDFRVKNVASLTKVESQVFLKHVTSLFAVRNTKVNAFAKERFTAAQAVRGEDVYFKYAEQADQIVLDPTSILASFNDIFGDRYHSALPINSNFSKNLTAFGYNEIEPTLFAFTE